MWMKKAKSFLVIGCGSIGRRHISNLKTLGLEQVSAFDIRKDRREQTKADFDVKTHNTLQEGLSTNPDGVLICSPPHLHYDLALQALKNHSHIFIEKPISNTTKNLDNLINIAANKSKILMVGYNLRFNAALQEASRIITRGDIGRVLSIRSEYGQYLPNWRPNEDYRKGYITHDQTGGGIVLEESHEIDYVQWLGGETKKIFSTMGQVSDLEMQTEDMALMSLELADGILAQINVDCVQRGYWRQCKVIGTYGTLMWKSDTGIKIVGDEPENTKHLKIVPDPNDAYIKELEHFIKCMEEGITPIVDGKKAKQVLEVALAAKESSLLGREVLMSDGKNRS